MKTCIVIGGGAAGIFCAVNVARLNPQLKVIVIEKSNKLLAKVKVSGGGRCNLTHSCFDIAEMIKKYPRGQHFVKKIFHSFFTNDTISWFQQRGVQLKTEADGRMFPVSNSSQTIIDCLLHEAGMHSVNIIMKCQVNSVAKEEHGFVIKTSDGDTHNASYLCIATGGLSKGFMMDWLKSMDHTIETPLPSLFTFNLPKHPITKLMGISIDNAKVKISGTKFEQGGPLLITHWGLSGPSILRLSAYAAREVAANNWQFNILINWLPFHNEVTLKQRLQQIRMESGTQNIYGRNSFALPQRLWEFILVQSNINENIRWAELAAKEQNKLIANLVSYQCRVNGKTTFKEEFVTAGGVSLSEINATTMMSKKVDNLYFAGEVIDVDGITGGYNFQNAWSTGFVAAKAISFASMG